MVYSYFQDEDLLVKDYAWVLLRISQVGAGQGWIPDKTEYMWLGVNGTVTNCGVFIMPQGGNSPFLVDNVKNPNWINDFLKSNMSAMLLATNYAKATSSGAAQNIFALPCTLVIVTFHAVILLSMMI